MKKIKDILNQEINSCPSPIVTNTDAAVQKEYKSHSSFLERVLKGNNYNLYMWYGVNDQVLYFVMKLNQLEREPIAFMYINYFPNLKKRCIVRKGIKPKYKNVKFEGSKGAQDIMMNYLKKVYPLQFDKNF